MPILGPCSTGCGAAHGADSFNWSACKPSPGRARRLRHGNGSGGFRGDALALWPLPLALDGGEALCLELRGDPAGIFGDSVVGRAVLPLGELAAQHPRLLAGLPVQLRVALACAAAIGEKQQQQQQQQQLLQKQGFTASAGADGQRLGLGDEEGSDDDAEDEEEEVEAAAAGVAIGAAVSAGDEVGSPPWHAEPAAQAAAAAPAAAPPPAPPLAAGAAGAAGAAPTLLLTLGLEAVSCMDALQAVGCTPAAAQTCLAQLAEPGGLYLDVKSAYSSPKDLQVCPGRAPWYFVGKA